MKKLFTLSFLTLVSSVVFAQINHGGTPINWLNKSTAAMDVPFVSTSDLDMASINAEDEVVDQYKETPYRFGFDFDVNYNLFDYASETTRKNGDKIYRMGIHCPKATSVNFLFGDFYLPEGGEVFIWNEDRSEFLGAFTHENNKAYGSLAVGLLHDDKIVIEYIEPSEVAGLAQLRVSQISHGYRPVLNKWEEEKGPFGTSGSCNMNVNCADGNDWQQEKRGVALIVSGGNAQCTGSLINNTAQDGAPYFLTAAHCDGNETNWVFYFNHEYEGCDNSGAAPTNQSVSGASQEASTDPSDAHLLLLSEEVPSEYDPYFNGWDNSGDPVSLGIGIHHPSGDVKKLAFDDDPLTITQYLQTAPNDNFNHWRIELWERATTTEGGSSGSPLFDQNHRIIGQLHGGYANCANSVDDYYGAMHSSWPTLSPFLDPTGSGVTVIDGYGPYDITYDNDAQAGSITGLPTSASCEIEPFDATFQLRNNGVVTLTAATIEVSFNGSMLAPINWTGSLAQDEAEDISLGTLTPEQGPNNLTVTVSTATDDNANNNMTVANFNGSAVSGYGSESILIEILTDDYGSESSWELIGPSGTVVLSGDNLENNTTYNEEYPIEPADEGCYEFIFYDSYGDGICCAYGNGYYEVTDPSGTVLAEGGEFGDSESVLVSMVNILGIDESEFEQGISVYPNPTEDILNVEIGQNEDFQVEIFDLLGASVYNGNSGNNNIFQLNVSEFSSGVYILKLTGESDTGIKRFTVK